MMTDNKKKQEPKDQEVKQNDSIERETRDKSSQTELSIEEKLKEAEDKLLRSLAEIENQRRRFEKEIKDAFEFGSFNFSKEILALLDNLQRAKLAIKNDNELKKIRI